jgi:hypothetical protein
MNCPVCVSFVEDTMKKWLQVSVFMVVIGTVSAGFAQQTIIHPGILHTLADITRMISKVNAGAQPWKGSWDKLVANSHAQTSYTPNPQQYVCCGTGGCPGGETFMPLANDCAAAYQCALRYRISGNAAYADKAVQIMNAWSSTLLAINGDSNAGLRAGLYGYQFAAAAELMRGYSGWAAADFTRFKTMMLTKFYTINSDFLIRHNGTCFDHYWANWDLANMTSIIGIAVLCDDTAKFNEAVTYFKSGVGTGQIDRLCNHLYPGTPVLGQGQESGRDQGHATLCISLIGAFCQIACNQGQDLFAYNNNKVMALCEYTAKYNLGNDVPWTNYTNCEKDTMTAISSSSRGTLRPSWELIYNHYVRLKGLYAPFSKQFADSMRPEGGGGNYGANSGGYDQLGFGTLTFTLDSITTNVSHSTHRQSCTNAFLIVTGRYLHYTISYDASVNIRVFDMKGVLIGNLINTKQKAGSHACVLDRNRFRDGTYVADLSDGSTGIRQKIVIVN